MGSICYQLYSYCITLVLYVIRKDLTNTIFMGFRFVEFLQGFLSTPQ